MARRGPCIGNLGRATLDTLLGLLDGPEPPCFFALWEGFGWIHGTGGNDPPELPREVIDGPRLQLPGRDHIVFSGPLQEAVRIGFTWSWGEVGTSRRPCPGRPTARGAWRRRSTSTRRSSAARQT